MKSAGKTVILGLTGSIGMGKSTTAAMFADAGIPVWDADAAVHRLYAPGGAAVAPLTARLGDVVASGGAIDRAQLRAQIAADPRVLSVIESIVHPLVAADRAAFVADAAARKVPLVVLDIPLLFEGGLERTCDATIVVTAPPEVQRARVLGRPGMTPEHLDRILALQMPDSEKRRRATHVIETNGMDEARNDVHKIVNLYRASQDLPHA